MNARMKRERRCCVLYTYSVGGGRDLPALVGREIQNACVSLALLVGGKYAQIYHTWYVSSTRQML